MNQGPAAPRLPVTHSLQRAARAGTRSETLPDTLLSTRLRNTQVLQKVWPFSLEEARGLPVEGSASWLIWKRRGAVTPSPGPV